MKWDYRFIEMAKLVASWSKDPSTQTGAVITRGKQVISVGFNGFASKIKDTPERLNHRETKYKLVIHCEENAVRYAGHNVEGCTLYTWPFMSCSRCASRMIHEGIVRHVAPAIPADKLERWAADMKESMELFKEAGVEVVIL